jgi:hypothetical protein
MGDGAVFAAFEDSVVTTDDADGIGVEADVGADAVAAG